MIGANLVTNQIVINEHSNERETENDAFFSLNWLKSMRQQIELIHSFPLPLDPCIFYGMLIMFVKANERSSPSFQLNLNMHGQRTLGISYITINCLLISFLVCLWTLQVAEPVSNELNEFCRKDDEFVALNCGMWNPLQVIRHYRIFQMLFSWNLIANIFECRCVFIILAIGSNKLLQVHAVSENDC